MRNSSYLDKGITFNGATAALPIPVAALALGDNFLTIRNQLLRSP
jgi:hypothetical protein